MPFIKNTPFNNEILRIDNNCYVSYNPSMGDDEFMRLVDKLNGVKTVGTAETALNIDNEWIVLKGDHREAVLKGGTKREEVLKTFQTLKKKFDTGLSTRD